MNGFTLRFAHIGLIATLFLTACGQRAENTKSERAIGAKTALGKMLTSSRWCTAPTETSDVNPNPSFAKLEIRENGVYIKTVYKLSSNNALEEVGGVRGTWAVVGDQFFTRATRTRQVRQKVTVRTTNVPTETASTVKLLKQDSTETCLNLGEAVGVIEAYCTCVEN